jgi:2Fe-2S ferredoxin
MPKLTLQNLGGITVNVQAGQTVLQQLHAEGIDWMHACGGKGRCTSCRMIVIDGSENIGPLTEAERRFKDLGRLKDNERLTCQCTLTGQVTARVPEATKLPHMVYTEY